MSFPASHTIPIDYRHAPLIHLTSLTVEYQNEKDLKQINELSKFQCPTHGVILPSETSFGTYVRHHRNMKYPSRTRKE